MKNATDANAPEYYDNGTTGKDTSLRASPFKKGQCIFDEKGKMVTIVEMRYNRDRGWIVHTGYIQNEFPFVTGGSSFWNESKEYRLPNTVEEHLRARIVQNQIRIKRHEAALKKCVPELERDLEFASLAGLYKAGRDND
jgi:hypothetical protein